MLTPMDSEFFGLPFRKHARRMFWRHYRKVPSLILPHSKRAWVLDRGSLTKRLIQASKGDFKVRIIGQKWARPRLDEQRLLDLPNSQKALIREVALICDGKVWVHARSIIPLATLSGAEKTLACLGARPLGAFLFKAKTMRRGPLQLATLQNDKQQMTGRRSIFYIHGKPILVSEFFLPALFEHV